MLCFSDSTCNGPGDMDFLTASRMLAGSCARISIVAAAMLAVCATAKAQERGLAPADSVALRVYAAHGGAEVWEAVPLLGFTYSVIRGPEKRYTYRHFWNRRTGQYRLELPGPANEPYVILFNVHTGGGRAYWNGSEIPDPTLATLLEQAQVRFSNDTFWLTAPLRLFDPGVRRRLVPDSTTEALDVLHISFEHEQVGPGLEYWLYVDKATGRIREWRYRAPDDGEDAPLRPFEWADYEEHITPAGVLLFSGFKHAVGMPYGIRTDRIVTPTEVATDMYRSGAPLLTPTDTTQVLPGNG